MVVVVTAAVSAKEAVVLAAVLEMVAVMALGAVVVATV